MSLSYEYTVNMNTAASLSTASSMEMKAKADILSCAIMSALYGTLITIITVDAIEHCSTQNAAVMRSAGICICVYRNQSPAVSPNTVMSTAMSTCICMDVLNTLRSSTMSPLPREKMMYRCVADAMELLMKPNMATTPPTTL